MWIAVIALVAAVLMLYLPSVLWLTGKWRVGGALTGQGFALASVSLLLIIRSARGIEVVQVRPAWWGLAVVVAVSFVWLLATLANVAAVHTTILPLLAISAIYAAFGQLVGRRMAFPVMYTLFALPIWQDTQFIFQAITTYISSAKLGLLGITPLIEGDLIHVPAGTFRIADG